MVDGDEPGDATLDDLLPHHVRGVQPGLRAGVDGVLDLHRKRRAFGGRLGRDPGQWPGRLGRPRHCGDDRVQEWQRGHVLLFRLPRDHAGGHEHDEQGRSKTTPGPRSASALRRPSSAGPGALRGAGALSRPGAGPGRGGPGHVGTSWLGEALPLLYRHGPPGSASRLRGAGCTGVAVSASRHRVLPITWIKRTYHRCRRKDRLGRLPLVECEALTHATSTA